MAWKKTKEKAHKLSNIERQQKFIAGQKASGRKRISVWIHASRQEELKAFASTLQEA